VRHKLDPRRQLDPDHVRARPGRLAHHDGEARRRRDAGNGFHSMSSGSTDRNML